MPSTYTPTPWSRAVWLASNGTIPRMPTVSADWRASKVATRRLGIDPSPRSSRLEAWRLASACALATLIAIGVRWRLVETLVAVTTITSRPLVAPFGSVAVGEASAGACAAGATMPSDAACASAAPAVELSRIAAMVCRPTMAAVRSCAGRADERSASVLNLMDLAFPPGTVQRPDGKGLGGGGDSRMTAARQFREIRIAVL